MTDEELIAYLRLQGLDNDIAAADRIEAQAAEIERLEAKLERGLSVAKGIEMACLGLRDEAQPLTAKDAARKMIAALTGGKDE